MRWGFYYRLPAERQAWSAGAGKGKSWLAIVDADTEAGATMMYRVESGDTKPVLAVPLDQRVAA